MNFGIFQAAWSQPHKSIMLLNRLLKRINSEIRFLVFRIRTMAFVTLIGKNRPNLSVEIDLSRRNECQTEKGKNWEQV